MTVASSAVLPPWVTVTPPPPPAVAGWVLVKTLPVSTSSPGLVAAVPYCSWSPAAPSNVLALTVTGKAPAVSFASSWTASFSGRLPVTAKVTASMVSRPRSPVVLVTRSVSLYPPPSRVRAMVAVPESSVSSTAASVSASPFSPLTTLSVSVSPPVRSPRSA